jgi:hypothetical protein
MTTMPTITCPACSHSSTHPDDIAHGYCGNCHRFTNGTKTTPSTWDSANFQTQWHMVSVVGELISPVIEALDVLPIAPSDTLPESTREMLIESGDDVSLRRGTLFYNGAGEPIDPAAAPLFKTLQHIDAVRQAEGGLIETNVYSSDGVPVRISTTFMGIDMSTGGVLPLIWETLLIVGDQPGGVLEPVRYATRAAAHIGHVKVADAVRAALDAGEQTT